MAHKIYNRIGKNSLYILLRRFLEFPVGLILPPVVLGYIGIEGYGVWALIQALVAYSAILDMGIDSTIMKYVAEYKSLGNYQKIIQMFNTFFVVYSVIFSIFFLVVFIYQDWIIDVFIKTSNFTREDISFTLLFYTVVFGINIIFRVYSSTFNGMERMDLTNKVGILSIIGNFIFSVFFLYMGWGIKGLAIASGLSSLITIILYVSICAKRHPYLKLNPFLFNFNILSKVYKFTTYGAIGGILAISHFHLSKLIITYFLGLRYLTYYDLGSKLVFFSFGLLGSFSIPLIPAASGVYASSGEKKLKEVFQITFKYIALIATPVFLFASVMADRIIFVWLGAGYEEAAFVLRFLSIAYLILALTGPGASILSGMGMPKIPFYGTIIAMVVSIVLSLILVTKFGITGILIGTLSAYTLTAIYSLYYFQKKLGDFTIYLFLKALRFPLLTSMTILFILSFIYGYVGNYYIELASAAILFPITYIVFAYKNPEYGGLKNFIRQFWNDASMR